MIYRKRKTLGYQAYRIDGTTKRFSTLVAARQWAGPLGSVARIKRTHNATKYYTPLR